MGLVGKEGIPLQPYHCDSLCPLHHQCSCGCGGGGGEEAPWGVVFIVFVVVGDGYDNYNGMVTALQCQG